MQAYPNDIFSSLQKEILCLQGYKTIPSHSSLNTRLAPISDVFPNKQIPFSTIHEFICSGPESFSATSGFVTALSGSLMKSGGTCIWISSSPKTFPSSMPLFGIEPQRIIFVNPPKEKDVLWLAEEALKCNGLAAVITETKELSFTESRRLQLAVEKSQVTGFLLRQQPRLLTPNACSARWAISPAPSETPGNMPGVGFPRWHIELLKVRNGNTGRWMLEWNGKTFNPITTMPSETKLLHRKTG